MLDGNVRGLRRRTGIEARLLQAAIDLTRNWYWDDPERHRVGRADVRAASAHIVGLALQSFSISDAELAKVIADSYRDRRDAFMCLYPGAVDTLQELRRRDVRLALLTNGSALAQRGKVERFCLAGYFECLLSRASRDSASRTSASTAARWRSLA
jgi:FMN phosphatase YigB (HAD superfamily)